MRPKYMPNKSIRTLNDLVNHHLIPVEELPLLEQVVDDFLLGITPEMHQLIDKTNPTDPIAMQFVPTVNELEITPSESDDPIGDQVHQKTKGIIHRYPDRCLLTPVHVCPVYCRFCFRKEKIGMGSQTLTPKELDGALEYIGNHPEIWEVILTGGDPLILKPAQLAKLLQRLCSIKHVDVIRIHTRIPVVDSDRINEAMLQALQCEKPVYVVLHANHPNEFTPNAIKACHSLVKAGIPMLGQTVLLKNINNDIETLSTLMRCFIKNRIKPYYLHQGDLVRGSKHFRTTIEEGQRLMKALRGRFSGICQPTYVLDIPGGYGKVPIGPQYLHESMDETEKPHYRIEDYQGHFHDYALIP